LTNLIQKLFPTEQQFEEPSAEELFELDLDSIRLTEHFFTPRSMDISEGEDGTLLDVLKIPTPNWIILNP
jgi:hypothetical protein